jgi:phosphate starvation-inducible protein PhoH and related proteins
MNHAPLRRRPDGVAKRSIGGGNVVLNYSADASNEQLANLTGVLDSNLRQIESTLEVSIKRRGHQFRIAGKQARAQDAVDALEYFLPRADRPISVDDIQLHFVDKGGAARTRKPAPEASADEALPQLHTRRRDLYGRTPRQREYIEAILAHDMAFAIGPAGTGKTYLAVACAVDALERDAVERIVLTRPAVEAGERLGFLPGDLAQKVDPYLRPLYDALFDLLGFDKTQRLLERQTIEIAPLAYMRGRTLNQAFVILDEAQNTTPEQMKMFLTRIGFGSRAVITGDVTQIDLPHDTTSGLVRAQHILRGVRGISFTYFTAADVVRHPLVARIVEAYERAEKNDPLAPRQRRERRPDS